MTTAGVKRPFASSAGCDAIEIAKTKLRSTRYSTRHDDLGSVTTPSRADCLPDPASPSGKVPGFRHDATLVLVGLRGSGKSTLAVMASTALNRTVIDLEATFQRAHGVTTSSYRKSHGSEVCQRQQVEILRDALKQNATGRILVCWWIDQKVQSLLREFAMTNPVVHIVRDAEAIKSHLRVDNDRKVESLLAFATPFFRECSSFEFFNITEKSLPVAESAPLRSAFIPSLTLKRAETHFTKFLSLLYPVGTIPFVDSAFPLASVPLEERQFTYIIPLAIADILSVTFDIEEALCGADAVQVTVDIPEVDDAVAIDVTNPPLAAQITKAVAIVRRSTVLPVVCHLRVQEAASASTWDIYMKLICHAFKLAPEMVTIDLRLDSDNIRRVLRSRHRSKVMGCYEMSTPKEPWSSQYWRTLYGKAVDVGCDTARFTRPASSPRDNVEVAQFRATLETAPNGRIPATAYNSGRIGRTSACFNSLLTVTSIAATSDMARETAIDQSITPLQATAALFASFVYEPMKLYVFGAKVDYSMSPIMHNSALQAYGIPHVYRPHSTSSLSGIQDLLQDPYFGGASIGLPFKVEVMALAHSFSRHARIIGAVNTLIPIRQLKEDGSVPTGSEFFHGVNRSGTAQAFYGENTDWIGIKACIQRGLSPANAVRPTTCGVIIGAGGMARAAAYAMLRIGVRNIVMCNRTPANAQKVAAHFERLFDRGGEMFGDGPPVRFHVLETRDEPWPANFRVPTILISCVPTHQIGDEPAPNFTAPESWLASPTGGVIFEIGYKTLDTPLLRQARAGAAKGWIAMDGLDLLPEQGFAQFELFTGRRAPRGLMRRELFKHYKDEGGSSFIPDLQRRLQMLAY